MKVRMLAEVTVNSGPLAYDSVYDTSDEEAARLVALGLAMPEPDAKPASKVETAAIEAPENTMRRRPGPRKNAPRGEEKE